MTEEKEQKIRLSWIDDVDDIHEYCEKRGTTVITCDEKTLREMTPEKFLKYPFFTNTEIVQKHLIAAGLGEMIPDTYDDAFKSLFHRKIYIESSPYSYPVFFKPVGNGKDFEGAVVSSQQEQKEHLLMNNVDPENVHKCYFSSVVEIAEEKRVLIGGGKLYNERKDVPKNFLKKLVEFSEGRWLCIDVGKIDGKWGVVEVNPPFSLDNRDIPLEEYMEFCLDFCAHAKKRARFLRSNDLLPIVTCETLNVFQEIGKLKEEKELLEMSVELSNVRDIYLEQAKREKKTPDFYMRKYMNQHVEELPWKVIMMVLYKDILKMVQGCDYFVFHVGYEGRLKNMREIPGCVGTIIDGRVSMFSPIENWHLSVLKMYKEYDVWFGGPIVTVQNRRFFDMYKTTMEHILSQHHCGCLGYIPDEIHTLTNGKVKWMIFTFDTESG